MGRTKNVVNVIENKSTRVPPVLSLRRERDGGGARRKRRRQIGGSRNARTLYKNGTEPQRKPIFMHYLALHFSCI